MSILQSLLTSHDFHSLSPPSAAVSLKWFLLNLYGRESYWSQLLDRTVFASVKEITGGRIRIALTGGAPISHETHRFMYSTLGHLLQGYGYVRLVVGLKTEDESFVVVIILLLDIGLTEICGLGAITLPEMGYRLSTIGAPGPSLEIKLVSVEGTDYRAEGGQGEIWLRGPSVMKGYYKQPEQTQEALTEDGWFRSGDIGIWNPDGTMSITDRIKNLVKLSNGEYVALEQLESRYRDSVKIKNVCLLAQGGKDFILGVVEPSDDQISKEDLLADLKAIARKTGCSRSETVRDIALTHGEDWMTNGFLTTSGKLKRREIEKRFKKEIEEMYKQH
ncbi:hypothetical protein BC936DRAFT_138121 [Jimgerdemannia flammicorona]|uniref:AMP-dependent synthetase/ligase domain-containing protein n=1 Tax=Jimgerdemannia flammicorona TaxID=994334 RepID=A0A433CVT3_9FUNG|nr:hypothetical protein BC936DRAFT_138121 [Jimgerdemannia flammicorona]